MSMSMMRVAVSVLVAVAVVVSCGVGTVSASSNACMSPLVDGNLIYSLEFLTGSYTAKDGATSYTLTPCAPSSCGVSDDQAGCQTTAQGSKHGMGLQTTAVYSFDVPEPYEGVRIEYKHGEACSNGDSRSVAVNVVCDPGASLPVTTFLAESSHCHYEVMIKSRDACGVPAGGSSPAGCDGWSPAGTDLHYVPELLTLPGDEKYSTQEDTTTTLFQFDVNVCGAVECPGTDTRDPPAVCQTSGNADVYSLGSVSSTTFFPMSPADAGYVMEVSHGDACHDGTERTTRVSVYCSPTDVEPRLVFDGELSHCTYALSLFAADGCPVDDTPSPPPAPLSVCPAQLQSEDGTFHYEPRALAVSSGSPYTVVGYGDEGSQYTYELNVCGTVAGCYPANSDGNDGHIAACQTENSASPEIQHGLGLSTAVSVVELYPPGEGFTVTYTGGDPCSSGDERTTLIHAHCVVPDGDYIPPAELYFVGETSHCVYEFNLFSPDACPIPNSQPPPTTTCAAPYLASTAHPGKVYDFHALSRKATSAHDMTDVQIGDDVYEFTVNVCDPVDCVRRKDADIQPAGCQIVQSRGGSGSSTTTTTGPGPSSMYALGDVRTASIEENDQGDGYVISYTGGDICHSGQARTLNIHVLCVDGAPSAVPMFREESSHCVYDIVIHADTGACPISPPASPQDSSGMSGVAVFFIVVIVLVIAVVGGALAYQTYKGEPVSDLLTSLPACPCGSAPQYRFERLSTEDPDLQGAV